MSKASVRLSEIKAELMKDPAFREEYEALQPHYQLNAQVIREQAEQNVTHDELARRMAGEENCEARYN